ncbi:hypothetical protein ACOME3_010738 [Neoechinorhynchus agilis]
MNASHTGNDIDRAVQKSNHKYKQLIKRELMAAIRPPYAKFSLNHTPARLIKVVGLLPITFRSSTYNIPLSIELPEMFPYTHPEVFVKPTKQMVLSSTCPTIDSNSGRVIALKFLKEWKHPSSDLSTLLQALSTEFGTHTPVYASTKPLEDGSRTSTPSSMYPAVNEFTSSQVPKSFPALPDSVIKTSLMSAAMDAGRRRISNIYHDQAKELSLLVKAEQDLVMGAERIDSHLEEIRAEKLRITEYIERLKEAIPKLEKTICSQKENQSCINSSDSSDSYESAKRINEIMVTTAPVYKQIFESHAEDCAIHDALYLLGEIQRKKLINLDTFLRQNRELARRQFFLRATILKARRTANI